MGRSLRQEALDAALDAVKEVGDIDNKVKAMSLGSKYRTRVRSLASTTYEVGLLSTLAFAYSSSGDGTCKAVQQAGWYEKPDRPKSDEASYALYLKHVLGYLNQQIGFPLSPSMPLEALKSLAKDQQMLLVAERLLEPFLVELKHFAEALFEPEEER